MGKLPGWIALGIGCMSLLPCGADEVKAVKAPSITPYLVSPYTLAHRLPAEPTLRRGLPAQESSLAMAINRATRKGIVEQAVEAYSDVLIQCQKEQSPALTTPFMRSDSQQAHCFRF
ncbi:MAG: hypothetical protein V4463_04660 [Pseudomonadota bacterium]